MRYHASQSNLSASSQRGVRSAASTSGGRHSPAQPILLTALPPRLLLHTGRTRVRRVDRSRGLGCLCVVWELVGTWQENVVRWRRLLSSVETADGKAALQNQIR